MTTATKPDLGSQAEAAARAHVSARTIARWIKAGRLTPIRNGASPLVWIDLNQIDAIVRGLH